MTTLSIKTARPAATIRAERIAYDRIPATPAERATALALLIDGDAWTLAEYVAWINRDAATFALMGAAEWAERGITTASALGDLLDAENERNLRKEAMYG
jgi:hypothetical protein